MTDPKIKNLINDLSSGKINRRDFFTKATAFGISATMASTLISRPSEAAKWVNPPKKGGHLIQAFGHGSTTDQLDPATFENGYQQNVGFSLGNHLTEVDNNGQLIPELSTEYSASPDAKTWTFKLRKGVEFHNGKTMNADDVITSFNHHRGEDSKSAAKGVISGIKDIRKDGNDTVVFELSDGNSDFPYIVSDYHLIIFPEKDGKMDYSEGRGTGGYILESYEPGVKSTFKRNPNYWKEGRAHFDSVENISMHDTAARQNALMNGDVHVIDQVAPKTAHLLERAPTVNLLETTGTLHYTFPMRCDTAPYDNYDVRMALKLSVDREEMVKKILVGHGAVGNDHPIGPSVPFYADGIPQRTFDPDKAKFHWKKSGAGNITLDLSCSDAAFDGSVDAAQLMKATAAKAGININVVREPSDGYWSNIWLNKAWCACYWGGRPTADWMFASAYIAESKWNDTFWKKGAGPDKFNKLVKEAKGELDTTKRAEMYAECQRLIHDDGGALIPMFANHMHGLSTKIAHDTKVAGNWQNDGNKSSERWWFA